MCAEGSSSHGMPRSAQGLCQWCVRSGCTVHAGKVPLVRLARNDLGLICPLGALRRKIIGRPMAMTEAEFPSLGSAPAPKPAPVQPVATDAAGAAVQWASIAAAKQRAPAQRQPSGEQTQAFAATDQQTEQSGGPQAAGTALGAGQPAAAAAAATSAPTAARAAAAGDGGAAAGDGGAAAGATCRSCVCRSPAGHTDACRTKHQRHDEPHGGSRARRQQRGRRRGDGGPAERAWCCDSGSHARCAQQTSQRMAMVHACSSCEVVQGAAPVTISTNSLLQTCIGGHTVIPAAVRRHACA